MDTMTDKLVEALLPCPFCGGTSVSVHEGSTFRWRFAACNECDAQAGEVRCQTLGDGTKDKWEAQAHADAVKEWNRRAQPAQAAQPVAWMLTKGRMRKLVKTEKTARSWNGWSVTTLYAAPQPPAPKEIDAARVQELERENAKLRATNESVRVCRNHTAEVTADGECLVCRAERAEAANRDCVDHFEQMRDELAAVRKRIAEAPSTLVTRHPAGAMFVSVMVSERWEGKRVALLPLDDEAKDSALAYTDSAGAARKAK